MLLTWRKHKSIQANSLLLLINTVIIKSAICLSVDKDYQHHQAIQEASEKSISDLSISSNQLLEPRQQNVATSSRTIQVYDNRRPIWVIAHMVNSIKELDYRLSKGANAVEVDVTFGRNGDPLYAYHGPPCDCWRHCNQQEDFNDYLSYVREIAIDDRNGVGQNLTLLFLDLKLDYLNFQEKARAGTELAKSILSNLYTGHANKLIIEPSDDLAHNEVNNASQMKLPLPKLRLILSVNHVSDIELIRNFVHHIEEQNAADYMSLIGFDVGMNDDLQMIESMWRRLNSPLNIWQGDGYTNCISPFYNLKRLTKALQKRDTQTGYPRKVYHWTIDIHDRMRESLRLGVDALMTNHPERVLKILTEPEMVQNYRIARLEDDPFKKIIKSGSRGSESARLQRSAHPTSDGFFGNLYDVVVSWINYIKEIPIFSFPTTSRLMKMRRPSRKTGSLQSKQTTIRPVSPTSDSMNASMDDNNNMTLSRSDSSSTANNITDMTTKDSGSISVSDIVDQSLVGQQQSANNSSGSGQQDAMTNEGPKWYISLASNLLVSFMKILLPADT